MVEEVISFGCLTPEAFMGRFNDGSRPRYLFGINKFSRSIQKFYEIEAYVDDYSDIDVIDGVKVIRTKNVPRNGLVVCCSVGVMPLSARLKLRQESLCFIDYFEFRKNCRHDLEPIVFYDGFKDHYSQNTEEYKLINDSLADEESKVTLDRIINFRCHQKLDYLRGFFNLQHRQYFEYFLNFGSDSSLTFLDVGGYDGATTLEFLKCYGFENKALVFEPEASNYEVSRSNLEKFEKVQCFNMGLSDSHGEIAFSSDGSSSGRSENSDTFIKVIPIDSLRLEKVDYIKMDIEGMEPLALKGARETISRLKPHLAICVYHEHDHILKVWQQVLSYYSDYKVYIRHYTEGVTETVMYFVPNHKKKLTIEGNMSDKIIETFEELDDVYKRNECGVFKVKPRVFFKAVEDKFKCPVNISLQIPSSKIGSVTTLEAAILGATLKLLNPHGVFEFGTFLGYSTSLFSQNTSDNCEIYSVDLGELADGVRDKFEVWDIYNNDLVNDDFLRSTQKEIGTYYLDVLEDRYKKKIKLLKMDSTTIDVDRMGLSSKFDFVFIDGGHTREIVSKDTNSALEMIGNSGIIFWHDYNSQIHGDVTSFLSEYSKKYKIFHVEHTLLAFMVSDEAYAKIFKYDEV